MGCAQLSKKHFKVVKKCPNVHWYCLNCEPNTVKTIKANHDVEKRCRSLPTDMESRLVKMEGELQNRVTWDEVKVLIAQQCALNEMGSKTSESIVKVVSTSTADHPTEEEVSTTIVDHSTEEKVVSTTTVDHPTEEEAVSTVTDDHSKEDKDKEARKLNVIIHHIPENQVRDSDEEQDTDENFVTGLTSVLEIQDAGISKLVRLGKVPDNQSKPRPIKVSFNSGNAKKKFMSKLVKLAEAPDKYKKISVSHDMTKEERDQNRKLVAEAKNLNGQEPTGQSVFRVRGLPGRRKIIKVEVDVKRTD